MDNLKQDRCIMMVGNRNIVAQKKDANSDYRTLCSAHNGKPK